MDYLTNQQWQLFFQACSNILGSGNMNNSRCAFTTFCMLESDLKYWVRGLPNFVDINSDGIADGGVWGQPFLFSDIAHIIIPQKFSWYWKPGKNFTEGEKYQDIVRLSQALNDLGIPHRLTDLVLEIKIY